MAEEEVEVFVCQAGTCRRHGSEAVLAEIEELVTASDDGGGSCTVRPTGCVGYCSQAPNAIVRKHGGTARETIEVETEIRSLEKSAKLVERATGSRPRLDDPAVGERFARLRAHRAREHAREVFHWNAALRGLDEQPELAPQLAELTRNAGYKDGVVRSEMPKAIKDYCRWTLESVTPATKHSAVYSFVCKDRKRGTPHTRGRGRRPELKTWHTTLLAEVGPNAEGPLPWIERDYTPISSAAEWEKGRVDLLVKIYPDGAATSWLHKTAPSQVWLSRPVKTLGVPSLSPDSGSTFSPAGVLLLLAGTGAVALPQVLHHRDPTNKLALSTHRRDQLRVPIDCIVSCRDDDVLLLPQIAGWCREGEEKGVRHCTLLLTAASHTAGSDSPPPPFAAPEAAAGAGGGGGSDGGDEPAAAAAAEQPEQVLAGIENANIVRSRLSPEIVAEAVGRMPRPCRVVVSGPNGFNSAAREMLASLVDEEEVTILAA